ncbi:MAG TPA: hypothetical protein VE912_12645 [Bacteroidales bacterium]|nr:hypothetical protein [Bacteroidales bacterium]
MKSKWIHIENILYNMISYVVMFSVIAASFHGVLYHHLHPQLSFYALFDAFLWQYTSVSAALLLLIMWGHSRTH